MLRPVVDLLDRLVLQPVFQQRFQRVPVDRARQEILEEFGVRPFGIAHQLNRVLPLVLFNRKHINIAVAAGQNVLGNQPKAQSRRCRLIVRPGNIVVLHNGDQTFLDRDVDMLASARPESSVQGSQRGDTGVDSGLEAGLLTGGLEGRQVRSSAGSTQKDNAARRPHG